MPSQNLQPQFVTKPTFSVVGLRIHTKPMTPEIPQLWDQFVPRMGEIQHGVEPGVSYGLMENVDQKMGEATQLPCCQFIFQ